MQDIFTDISKFKEYLKLKPKYFILKWSVFRKNPILAKLILKINAEVFPKLFRFYKDTLLQHLLKQKDEIQFL